MRLTRAEIDVGALHQNIEGIRKKVGPRVKIMGIVKANAYGHGMVGIAHAMVRFGVDYLGVGFLEEGIELRASGIHCPVLVLGGLLGNQVTHFLEYDLDITVSSVEIAERINAEAQASRGKKVKVHLKIDTGMERIGVRAENAPQFIEKVCRLPHLDVVGIYSHLATADEREKSFTRQQLERFDWVLTNSRKMGVEFPLVHIANSGAVIDHPESYHSMVRPGIMTYGIYPSHETSESIPLKPVLSLKSKVVYVKEVPKQTGISYGLKYFTSTPTRVATVPVGYGDGYTRRLTNNSEVIICDQKHPVVGTICMDQFMVDVGMNSTVHVGDDVTLIGREGNSEVTAWDLADRTGTIPYEILTGIASRVPRVFIEEQSQGKS